MSNFFKIFFASLLALLVFFVLGFFLLLGMVSSLAAPEKVTAGQKAVLVVDLSHSYDEIPVVNPFAAFTPGEQYDVPSLYDLIRLIQKAKTDSSVKGIYVRCGTNNNGFAASEEIRNALLDFKSSRKFIYAYADVIPQRAYYVANVADKIYCNPKGGVDWVGFSMQLAFLKGTLEKLEIEPQIFYAGKFKSATEPLREYKMTDANRIQSTQLLNDLYGMLLQTTSQTRGIDTATLHRYANENLIRFASDAAQYKLVDGLRYDDEVKDEIRQLLKISKDDKINFVTAGKYANAVTFKQRGTGKMAIIYAAGDIIDGKGERGQIGSETYVNLIRKVRMDKSIKAIVFRINSGGGSALASENIWRELSLAKKEKPVVLSFGDVAASGGYYLSCNADTIFASPNTITGSIGVFSLLPNMQKFFNKKLGVTFDEVKTSPDAGALTITRPLTETQKRYIQQDVDSIYFNFKSRVAQGRKKGMEYIDSIAQGRVWSGKQALTLGLVDKIGGLKDAVACAARMAGLQEYKVSEYPEPQSILKELLGDYQQNAKQHAMKEELGPDGMKTYLMIKKCKDMMGVTQTRMPFDFSFE